MKEILLSFLAAFSLTAQAAQPVNILLSAPPGGIYDAQNRTAERALKSSGFETNYVILNNCKATHEWLKNNPTKPAVFIFSMGEQATAINDPNSDGACGIIATPKNVVTISLSSNSNICTLLPKDQAMERFLSGKSKIGATFIPPTNKPLVEGLISSLGLNSTAIMYQGNPKLLQALVSKDIDFALFANVAPAISAGAHCFLTTAPRDRAQKLGRTSLAEISPSNPWIDSKQVYVFLGQNVDMPRMRTLINDSLNNDPEMKKQIEAGWFLSGTAAGTTVNDQWKILDLYLKQNTKK